MAGWTALPRLAEGCHVMWRREPGISGPKLSANRPIACMQTKESVRHKMDSWAHKVKTRSFSMSINVRHVLAELM